jgi:predicted AAA+ superfamily ATPase
MTRHQLAILSLRLQEPRRFMQILAGPRQVGKTTIARAAATSSGLPYVYASADGPSPPGAPWIDHHWDVAVRESRGGSGVLVLDEVQKVPRWSEVVKARWDDDSHHGRSLRVVLLGSAPLLVQQGLTESLAGRFELIRVPHWSFPARWAAYVRDALVETTISRDVLLMTRVDKPTLLRQLFDLAIAYSGRELS